MTREVRAPQSTGDHRTAPEHPLDDVLPGEARVLEAAQESLAGRRRGVRGAWPFLGPAFIAAVAYIDPGNFATNMAAGATFGYLLLWVVLAANLIAMLVQSMSAKLGVATRMNLAEVCRARFSRKREPRALGSGGGDRDGHRCRRVHRGGARAQPPLRDPALPGGAHHGRGGVRHPRAAVTGVPSARGRHRRVHRRHRRRVRIPGRARRSVTVGHRRRSRPRVRRDGERAPRRRHPRRDGDAARHLPALGAHTAPRRRGER